MEEIKIKKLRIGQRYGCEKCKLFLVSKDEKSNLSLSNKLKKIEVNPASVSFICACGQKYKFMQ